MFRNEFNTCNMKTLFRSLALTGLSLVTFYGPFLTMKYAPKIFGTSKQPATSDVLKEADTYETMELEMLTPADPLSGYTRHENHHKTERSGRITLPQDMDLTADRRLTIAFNRKKTKPIVLDQNDPIDQNVYPAVRQRDTKTGTSVFQVVPVSYFAYHPLSKQTTDPIMRQRVTFFQ